MRFNETLRAIKPYEAGKPIELVMREYGIDEKEIIKLASNENPYGTSARVVERIKKEAHKVFMYPDDSMYELKNALASHYGIDPDSLIIGAGSDQILEFCARAVLNERSAVLMSKITFAMYEIYAMQQGAKVIRSSCYRHDLDEFFDLHTKYRPDIIHICTPNNPTGDALEREYLYSFLEKVKEPLIIVDGAYMEYASYKDESRRIDPKELIERFPNTIYLGTFSKAYGLGGMRVGYGIAQPHIITQLYKVRPPFNITILSQYGALEALHDQHFVKESVKKNFSQMERFVQFALHHGLEFIDSYTNFITFLLPQERKSSDIAQKLLEKGVIIRDLAGYGLNGVRITIGTPMQNDIFFEKFKEVLHEH